MYLILDIVVVFQIKNDSIRPVILTVNEIHILFRCAFLSRVQHFSSNDTALIFFFYRTVRMDALLDKIQHRSRAKIFVLVNYVTFMWQCLNEKKNGMPKCQLKCLSIHIR